MAVGKFDYTAQQILNFIFLASQGALGLSAESEYSVGTNPTKKSLMDGSQEILNLAAESLGGTNAPRRIVQTT